MDLAFLLILDAAALVIATLILTYFFLRDIFKNRKERL